MPDFHVEQPQLDEIVLSRARSPFAQDIHDRWHDCLDVVGGKRILVVGGAGTIGSATTTILSRLGPSTLHVVDQSENYLAELVRDLRNRPGGLPVKDFRCLPLDYGSPVMGRFLEDAEPYDLVLNFAALKHVRSEKDVYSLLQMIDTNVIKHVRFRRWLKENGHGERYFSVSTDKAANPTSLMGATKRLMEDVVFDADLSLGCATSARFANVAFSNGSLLQSFMTRLAKRQPLAVPGSTKRYFVSQDESGQICTLAALLGKPGTILFPQLDPVSQLQSLEDIAERVLAHLGYQSVRFSDEAEAIASVGKLVPERRWPLLVTALDTSGEKPYEEFVGHGEVELDSGLTTLGAVQHVRSAAMSSGVMEMLAEAVTSTGSMLDKAAIVRAIEQAIPNFSHRETGKTLDDRV